jgi:two-component system, OmpR family, response regulator
MSALTILVIDDDPDIRRMAALSLSRIGGFKVELASGGEQALEMVAREAPDAILLDVSMPGMDGPATLAALRRLPLVARVPVVFFTATSSPAESERLLSLGVAGVVAKPFDVGSLSARIRDILAKAGIN